MTRCVSTIRQQCELRNTTCYFYCAHTTLYPQFCLHTHYSYSSLNNTILYKSIVSR